MDRSASLPHKARRYRFPDCSTCGAVRDVAQRAPGQSADLHADTPRRPTGAETAPRGSRRSGPATCPSRRRRCIRESSGCSRSSRAPPPRSWRLFGRRSQRTDRSSRTSWPAAAQTIGTTPKSRALNRDVTEERSQGHIVMPGRTTVTSRTFGPGTPESCGFLRQVSSYEGWSGRTQVS